MANRPLVNAKVNITARDINNNNVAKQFNAVSELHFDYQKGMLNILDATGNFYFPITPMTTITYTITTGVTGIHNIVIS